MRAQPKASGEPASNVAVFDEPTRNLDFEWEWIPGNLTELSAESAAGYDASHVNLPGVTADSVGRVGCRVKIIARNGIWFDMAGVATCVARGITVTDTPNAMCRPVAVAALALVFALAGKRFTKDRLVRTGCWNERVDRTALEVTGRTLGPIGAGGMWQEPIPLARSFRRQTLSPAPYAGADVIEPLGAIMVMLDILFVEADFVIVACPFNKETRRLIDALAFDRMKPIVCFVTAARMAL